MLGRWGVRVPSRRARGWRRGGRGSAPSVAHRCRSGRQLAEAQTLAVIVNRDLTGFVLPHLHATATGRPMPALPLELQQTIFITHHPVLAYHPFFLQPEDFVQLPCCRPSPVIIGGFRRGTREAPVVLRDVVFFQKAVGFLVA